jgi:hypothetical protein
VQVGIPPPVGPTYAGEPKFDPIGQTGVARAVNSGYDVLLYGSQYYFCYSGAWYAASAPLGPWASTANVPAAIYTIPPSSPAYSVTQVKVEESSSTNVTYSYLPGYAAGMFVAYGMVYYGTGWYYPPYIYGPYYYPYWGSYGHGSWYNPATGGFASRSVWYGPYGGYSYTQGYNPRTGRYGYVETAWDGDEWGSYGQTYNPRTGVSTETSRHYNEDKDKSSMDRTVQRGDQWVQTERNTNWKEGTSETQRTTSGGGSSDVTRTFDDGTMTKEGTYTSGSGQTIDKTTVRGDGGSATKIEGSGGGQAASVTSPGNGRTTIAQSGSGDLYAGHDGNVYKKTDDGWQHYDNGGWQPAASPGGRGNYGTERAQLDRDYSARQMGGAQFQQRAGGFRGGGGRRR